MFEIIAESLNEAEKNEIAVYYSGESVLKDEITPDILFLDIEMPGMDGFEVAIKIKERQPLCKIIMATGRDDLMKESFKVAPFRFVSKPFLRDEVTEALLSAKEAIVGHELVEIVDNRTIHKVM